MPSLNPYSPVLGLRNAKHLLRRASFRYTKEDLESFADLTATEAVNMLLEVSPNYLAEPYDPYPSSNPHGYWTSSGEHPNTFNGQGRKRAIVTAWWWFNAYNQVSFKHKMSFFLHSCFTVGKDTGAGYSSNFYDHLRLLDIFSLGNIKTLAKKMTVDNSMLNYLDNTSNNANNPNENYAREFLELFTILKGPQIGEGDYTNYTETDVQQAARVFSGFKRQFSREFIDSDTDLPMGYGNKNRHDLGDKTFSHAFDNKTITGKDTVEGMFEELNDLVEMVFSKENTAKSYCRKLYRFFVKSEISNEVETDIINPLANLLISNNFEIAPVVQKLFSSEHFYDADNSDNSDEIIGAIVKSPLQLFTEVCSLFEVEFPDPNSNPLRYYLNFFFYFVHNSFMRGGGLDFFNPDSVAGYPANYQEPDYDRHWFSSNTLIARYKLIESLVYEQNTISGGKNYAKLDTVKFVENHIEHASDAELMIQEIANLMYPEPIDEDRNYHFVKVLLDGYNESYWPSAWQAYKNSGDNTVVKSRLDALIIAMVNAAEFQLM